MKNLLPYQGHVFYLPNFLDSHTADQYYANLKSEINWQNDEVVVFGKRFITGRKTAWHGLKPFEYTYSNATKVALPFSKTIFNISAKLSEVNRVLFNACLLNFYANGSEGMGWHSDNETTLNAAMPIASVSLGTSRKFYFRNRETRERVDIQLQHGSLLLMNPPTQQFWVHSLPKSVKINEPRINLTFRVMND